MALRSRNGILGFCHFGTNSWACTHSYSLPMRAVTTVLALPSAAAMEKQSRQPASHTPTPLLGSSASPLPHSIISSIITVLSSCIRLNFSPQWLGQPTSFKTACHNNDRIVIIPPAAMRASSCPVPSHMAPQSCAPHSTPASRPSASICSIWWCGTKGEIRLHSSPQCLTWARLHLNTRKEMKKECRAPSINPWCTTGCIHV